MLRSKIKVDTFVRDASGKTWLNEDASQVKGGVLIPANQAFVVPAATNGGAALGQAPIKTLESQSDCFNEILSLTARFSSGTNADVQARLLVEPRLFNRSQMSACNYPVLANHVFGTQLNPFYLQADSDANGDAGESILMNPRQYTGFVFYNPSTAGDATLSLSAESTKVTSRASEAVKLSIGKKLAYKTKIIPYWMTMEQKLSQGVQGVQLSALQSKYIFFMNKENFTVIITSIMGSVVTEGTGDSERVEFDLHDPFLDELLTDQPVSLNCGMGTASFPFRLRAPLVIPPRKSCRLKVTSLNTVGNLDLFMTMYGAAVLHENMGGYNAAGEYVRGSQPLFVRQGVELSNDEETL